MWPFSDSISDLAEQHLQKLKDDGVRECHRLDYKGDAPWDNVKNAKSGASEMLKDVSGLANAHGGYIIYGIEEDKGADDGTPKALVGIDDGPTWQDRVQKSCHNCIKPAIIGLHVREIKLHSGKWALVIEVPISSNRPHLVQRDDSRKFWCRHERNVLPMSIEEIRASVLEAYNAEAYRDQYLARRKQDVLTFNKGKPTLWMYAAPIFLGPERVDVVALRGSINTLPLAALKSTFTGELGRLSPSTDGLEVMQSERDSGDPREWWRVEHTGDTDRTICHLFADRANRKASPLAWIEAFLYAWTRFTFEFATRHLDGEPFLVGAEVLNAGGTHVFFNNVDLAGPCRHRELAPRPRRVAREDEWRSAAKVLADRIYNGYGMDEAPWFDADGLLKQPDHPPKIPWK